VLFRQLSHYACLALHHILFFAWIDPAVFRLVIDSFPHHIDSFSNYFLCPLTVACKDCKNKAKRGCSHGRCGTCCRRSAPPTIDDDNGPPHCLIHTRIVKQRSPLHEQIGSGQQVTGVVEGTFEHGLVITVRVGNTAFKGLLFVGQCAVKVHSVQCPPLASSLVARPPSISSHKRKRGSISTSSHHPPHYLDDNVLAHPSHHTYQLNQRSSIHHSQHTTTAATSAPLPSLVEHDEEDRAAKRQTNESPTDELGSLGLPWLFGPDSLLDLDEPLTLGDTDHHDDHHSSYPHHEHDPVDHDTIRNTSISPLSATLASGNSSGGDRTNAIVGVSEPYPAIALSSPTPLTQQRSSPTPSVSSTSSSQSPFVPPRNRPRMLTPHSFSI
jgi:hypothetical protein